MKLIGLLSVLISFCMISLNCSKNNITNNNEFIEGNWKVIAVENDSVNSNLTQEDSINITFANNQINGNSTGLCGNYFSGNFSIEEKTITFSNLSSTEALCPNSFYWAVYQVIEKANEYEFNDTLYLFSNGENKKLYLVKR